MTQQTLQFVKNIDRPDAGAPARPSDSQFDSYYIWTVGCQMNKADSERLGVALNQMGLKEAPSMGEAHVIVLNSCVVRQSAEDKVTGTLGLIKPLRLANPSRILAVMGCMVGPDQTSLKKRFPYVDVFMRPQDYVPLLDIVGERLNVDWEGCVGTLVSKEPNVSAYVPIIHGCDLFCSFCIIPYRRGRQVSRSIEDIAHEVQLLAARGVREVTLLGQTVDAYGADLSSQPDLADLLYELNEISNLERIRFLTSHPMFMTDRIIQAVADLPKVCEHINLPVQAGDDTVLQRMRRTYDRQQYLNLVKRIRTTIPGVALATDVIVGFCGETPEQFQRTFDLLAEVEFDKVHVAPYSTRPGTIAARKLQDDVNQEEKDRRRREIEDLQKQVASSINARLEGQTVEILVDTRTRGKWRGRTRTDKLVFFEDDLRDHKGHLTKVRITKTGPWSLQGIVV